MNIFMYIGQNKFSEEDIFFDLHVTDKSNVLKDTTVLPCQTVGKKNIIILLSCSISLRI